MLAIVFPGQGSQTIGMGLDFARAHPESARVFEEGEQAFGGGLRERIERGPDSELARTEITQPAILTASIAIWRALEPRLPRPASSPATASANAALVAAGGLPLGDAVRLVRRRGAFMQAAVPEGEGEMAAILGIDGAAVAKACASVDGPVSPANFNAPIQTVIAGRRDAVQAAARACQAAGAKRVVPLPVSAPFHCALMAPAAEKLRPELAAAAFADFPTPVISNVTAQPYTRAADARRLLYEQVCSPVRWVECVERLVALGATLQLEVGPGKVLSGLAAKIERKLARANVETLADVDAALAAAGRAMSELAGRAALVTGGSRGIGQAIAVELARAGAAVAFTYHSHPAGAEETAKRIGELGGRALALACDVADSAAVDALVARVQAELGGLDVAVNNAGIARDQLILRMKPEDFDAVIATNLRGTWNVCRAVAKPMLRARGGRIINVSSVVARMGNAGQTNYAASKGGVEALTRSLARELGSRGITVNTVAPGFIDTEMTAELPDAQKQVLLGQIPLGRLGTVEDVARAVRFLASGAAAYVTGQVIHVNGGLDM